MNRFRVFLKNNILSVLFSGVILGITIGVIGNAFSKGWLLELGEKVGILLVCVFVLALLIYVCLSFVHWQRKERTFWKRLRADEIEVINNYLNEIYNNQIKINFDMGFDPDKTHVSLSGILTPQAEEEKRPGILKPIKNIDKHLLAPNSKVVLVSGSPGAGKSTTLYKAFLNFKNKCNHQESTHIPIFLHANQIAKILEGNENIDKVVDFIECIYENYNSDNIDDFAKLCGQKSLKFLMIVDALDEFLDKNKRSNLFDYLDKLIEANRSADTRWILSCREDDYRAYSGKLKIVNVRLKPMNLKQRREFEQKRINELNISGARVGAESQKILLALKKAEDTEETFLSNPYYLGLWLKRILTEENFKAEIPSIEKLHETELSREIEKITEISSKNNESVNPRLLENTKIVLSVISYYLLEISLDNETHQALELVNRELVLHLSKLPNHISEKLVSSNQDEITAKRIDNYLYILRDSNLSSKVPLKNKEDNIFIKLLNKFKSFFSLGNDVNIRFLIVITSIIEQADRNRLIRIEPDLTLNKDYPFVNQRVRDYLVAYFLQLSNFQTLKQDKINRFWSRPIAIAIAISQEPDKLLESIGKTTDFVIESAIIDGLTLIPSQKKLTLKKSIKKFSAYFLDEKRLFDDNSDPCDPLRALRGLNRLCVSGYSDYIEIPDKTFKKLLQHQDSSIAESATTVLLLHACQTSFKINIYMAFHKNFIKKAFLFELFLENTFRSFLTTITESKPKRR
jgi:hypothetical protein